MLKYFPLLKIEGNYRTTWTNFIAGAGIDFDVDGDNVTISSTLSGVTSVNGQTGEVILNTSYIASVTDKRYVSDANLLILAATSGANTGDETTATIKSKLGISTLSGSNTGDQDLSGYVVTSRTVNGHALSSNVTVTASDLSLGNVDNTSDATKNSATATVSNKRWTRRVVAVSSSATPTINTDNTDVAYITGQATNITSFTTNITGTPNNGDCLIIDITDDGTPRTLAFGSKFEETTLAKPTTTVAGVRLQIGFRWNPVTSKWTCVAVV